MKRVFVDTAYFVALARKRDQLHRQAVKFEKRPPGQLLMRTLNRAASYMRDAGTKNGR
jgi:predicted nucleic acid-binding protein